MLVLEATSIKQGLRHDDYHWCNDRELAYKPGLDCASPDCGCQRGWSGVDSHRATTTVQVVDRPDFTVNDLATQLAVSLFDGGWIASPDPCDELVSVFVDETLEIANHFGAGAVLERDGDWTRVRQDDSTEPVNPFNRIAIEELTEDMLTGGPMSTMSKAVSVMSGAGEFVEPLLEALADAAWPEAQTLGCAIDWLQHTKLTAEWDDVPPWLERFDEVQITNARRRRGDDGDAYLLEMQVDGYELGIASVYVMHEGYIDSFFAIPDSIGAYTQLMKTLQRDLYKPYRKIAPRTARHALEVARDVPLGSGVAPGIAWPHNRPLLDFIADQMTWI